MSTSLGQRSKVTRKLISIICYVISGFFFYNVCVLAFVNEPPVLAKFAIMGGFCIPALIALGIGLACVRFQNWKRDVGIVITSAAGLTSFLILTIGCLFMSPEFKEFFPDNTMHFFSDYVSGISCMAILGTAGILLIWNSKKNAENDAALDGNSANAPSPPVR
jgi:hypothetical protein